MYLPAPDESVWVGVLRVLIRVAASRSIKDRRRVVSSLRDRIQARHQASFADVGHLDNPDQAVIAIAVVGNESRVLQSRLDAIRVDIESRPDLLVFSHSMELVPVSEHFSVARRG